MMILNYTSLLHDSYILQILDLLCTKKDNLRESRRQITGKSATF